MKYRDKDYIKEMKRYLKKLRDFAKSNPEEAKKEAMDSLIRTGVLDKNGNSKEQIVTESHLILSKKNKVNGK